MIVYKPGDIIKWKDVSTLWLINDWQWNDKMIQKWAGKIVVVTSVSSNGSIRFDGSGEWFYSWQAVERMATRKELRDQQKAEEEEALRTGMISIDRIGEIAVDVFGEDRVDLGDNRGRILIHFPSLSITNSEGCQHHIRDLFVKFTITPTGNDFEGENKYVIELLGKRTTWSLEEFSSNYSHSHLPKSSLSDMKFFCTGGGKSAYRLLLMTTMLYPTEDNWYLLFFGLENFLSWESLEGVPHIKMSTIHLPSQTDLSVIQNECKRIVGQLPANCFDYFGDMLRLNSGNYNVIDFFDKTSTLRQTDAVNKEALLKSYKSKISGFSAFYFKNKKVEYEVYDNNVELGGERKPISLSLVSEYVNFINNESRKFSIIYQNRLFKSAQQVRAIQPLQLPEVGHHQ